jgi:AcrR family transcriptional regulator
VPREPVDGPGGERERIRAALIDVVAELGYRSADVELVLERAGVDRRVFDRHFESLEDCFAAAWGEIDAELSRRMAAAYRRGEDWPASLRAALLAGLAFLAENESRARLYVTEAAVAGDRMRERQRAALVRLSATIDLARTEGDGEDRAPPGIADAVCGAIWHRVQRLVRTGRVRELPDQVRGFMYVAVLPYRGAEPALEELGRA